MNTTIVVRPERREFIVQPGASRAIAVAAESRLILVPRGDGK